MSEEKIYVFWFELCWRHRERIGRTILNESPNLNVISNGDVSKSSGPYAMPLVLLAACSTVKNGPAVFSTSGPQREPGERLLLSSKITRLAQCVGVDIKITASIGTLQDGTYFGCHKIGATTPSVRRRIQLRLRKFRIQTGAIYLEAGVVPSQHICGRS